MAKVYDMTDWSEKAMMHRGDADLFERVVLAQAARAAPRLEVLEWGSGRSTLYFTRRLRDLKASFRWTSLEYDHGYFQRELEPALRGLGGAQALLHNESRQIDYPPAAARGDSGFDLQLIVFNQGQLAPFIETKAADRQADLDEYVSFPSRLGRRFDLILVDGRMRRRCLLEAAQLMKPDGVTVLHDAHREYYHCALAEFRNQRFFGEIAWIGSHADGDLTDLLGGEAGQAGHRPEQDKEIEA